MDMAGLFDPEKWRVRAGQTPAQLMYDAGVSGKTRSKLSKVMCELITSGMVRKSKDSSLSFVQRDDNYNVSKLRIRVEDFIGIVKGQFAILRNVVPIHDIAIMDKMVATCFYLHNFGYPIIF